jgi:hypothetical protein
MSDEEGYLLCVDLFESDYSEEDIAEFIMRKFLKNIHNNYSFEITKMNNTVVVEDIVVVDNTIPVILDKDIVENTIPVVIDKPVVEDKKKTTKKSVEEEIENNMESYLGHFKANTNYRNEQ